ncbi:MAG: RAMP superfamily CRISPR-associated protein [Candidatus Scalindua sp.]|nr:RAMP superfamily CRISPR-associated protein [Candidatus Scalindua sp.]
MLKKAVNECRLTLTIHSKSPLLIKEGRYEQPESKGKMPDSFFVCRNTPSEIKTAVEKDDYSKIRFYLPGSSLRGVIRSHAEKIARTLIPEEPICCIPHNGTACKGGYKNSCVICKLFGSKEAGGRIHIYDSETQRKGKVIERYGNAIDRFTGGVSRGLLFKNKLLKEYIFTSQIIIRNFEIWQLGLLAYVLRDFNVFSGNDKPGLITVGFGKNRGFGRVKGSIGDVWITYFDRDLGRDCYELMGMGEIEYKSSKLYGFVTGDPLSGGLLVEAIIDAEAPYRKQCKVKDNLEFFKACADVWNKVVNDRKFSSVSK